MMMRFGLLAVFLIGIVVQGIAGGPTTRADSMPVPKEFLQPVSLSAELHETRLLLLLEIIAKRNGIRIDVDRMQLEKLIAKPLDQVMVEIPPGRLPMGAALELIAEQIHGTIDINKSRRCRIIPGRANVARFLGSPTPGTRKTIRELAEVERPITGASAKDVFEFLSEKYGVRVIASSRLVDNETRFGERRCKLAPDKKPLIEVVEEVARQIDGTVRVHRELILVVPRDRSES